MTDRRQFLQIALATSGVLAVGTACGNVSVPSIPIVPAQPDPTPDAQQTDEMALVAAYDAALADAPKRLRPLYRRIRDQHVEHVRALGWEGPLTEPDQSKKSLGKRGLITAEKKAHRVHTRGARTTQDAEMAQTLALIAASESQHVVALEQA